MYYINIYNKSPYSIFVTTMDTDTNNNDRLELLVGTLLDIKCSSFFVYNKNNKLITAFKKPEIEPIGQYDNYYIEITEEDKVNLITLNRR